MHVPYVISKLSTRTLQLAQTSPWSRSGHELVSHGSDEEGASEDEAGGEAEGEAEGEAAGEAAGAAAGEALSALKVR